MSDHSKIEWTDASWPITVGCDHITPGCDNCYAATLTSGRLAHQPAYAGLAANGRFNGTVRCLPERLDWPLRWRKPRKVFVCSMSDIFHAAVPDEFIAEVFAVMAATPQHTYQVLTKRHARLRSLLSSPEFRETVGIWAGAVMRKYDSRPRIIPAETWPLPNVWVGVSVEDQKWADIRIPALLGTPAAVRFISAEPLLGPVDLANVGPEPGFDALFSQPHLDWVIAGGESGAKARPMHPDWARSIRDQCQAADVPFLFKQWGEWAPAPWRIDHGPGEPVDAYKARAEATCATHVHTGNSYQEGGETVWNLYEPPHKPWSLERTSIPSGTSHEPIRRWGKKAAGRALDGRTWDEFPASPAARAA
jgi:protein gp37